MFLEGGVVIFGLVNYGMGGWEGVQDLGNCDIEGDFILRLY